MGSVANLTADWNTTGSLVFKDLNGTVVATIDVTNGIYPFSGPTVCTIIAATTLSTSNCGKVICCSTDGVIVTLPTASIARLVGLTYTIRNTASSGGALLVVKSADTTAEAFVGGGNVSGANYLLANTKATQTKGDYVQVMATHDTTAACWWYVTGIQGTWATAT